MTTIRDVAKQSGYSATTVSIVLNNAPLAKYISAETKKTIKKAAEQFALPPECVRAMFAWHANSFYWDHGLRSKAPVLYQDPERH
jgi:hypothetical protein